MTAKTSTQRPIVNDSMTQKELLAVAKSLKLDCPNTAHKAHLIAHITTGAPTLPKFTPAWPVVITLEF